MRGASSHPNTDALDPNWRLTSGMRSLAFLICALFVCACTSQAPRSKLYEGSDRATSELSVVVPSPNTLLVAVQADDGTVRQVSGTERAIGGRGRDVPAREAQLLPGRYRLLLRWLGNKKQRSLSITPLSTTSTWDWETSEGWINVTLKAGLRYRTQAIDCGDTVMFEVVEITGRAN